MHLFRKLGMYASLSVMGGVHTLRYLRDRARPASTGEVQGVRIIVIDERRVLLVAHWYAPWVWTLPGGGVEKNEDPEQAAMRETEEETGFRVHSIAGTIGTYRGKFGQRDTVRVYYTGDIKGSLAIKPNLEIMARSWFDVDHLPDELASSNRRRIDAFRAGVRNEIGRW